jgi:pimeloyl-ACP methyl ester carboxylesterase
MALHGSGGGLHSWAEVAEGLADEFEIWLVARRGYWPSCRPAPVSLFAGNSFADEAADVAQVLTRVQEETGSSVHLLGGSYGATVALHAALADARLVRTLALYEPPLFAAGPASASVLDRYRARLAADDVPGAMALLPELARIPQEILALFADAPQPDPDEAARESLGWLHDLEAMAGDSADFRRWSGITTRTLLMQGGDSWVPLPQTMQQLADALPQPERVSWPGQMHFATMTAPQLVANTLRDFWRRH